MGEKRNLPRAEYDADHRVLYVLLPGHPETPGCVKHTEIDGEPEDACVLYDVSHDDEVIGIEVLLCEPLDINSGDNGRTRTTNSGPPPVITCSSAHSAGYLS